MEQSNKNKGVKNCHNSENCRSRWQQVLKTWLELLLLTWERYWSPYWHHRGHISKLENVEQAKRKGFPHHRSDDDRQKEPNGGYGGTMWELCDLGRPRACAAEALSQRGNPLSSYQSCRGWPCIAVVDSPHTQVQTLLCIWTFIIVITIIIIRMQEVGSLKSAT